MSEKANKLSELSNQYVFEVYLNSNKLEIKQAIEKKFEVKVKKIRTLNYNGKHKNTSIRSNGNVLSTNGFRSKWKKAIVTLDKGNKIDLIGGEV